MGLDLLPGGPLDELLVHPGKLVHVEAGRAFLDVAEIEELNHLLIREEFFLHRVDGAAINLGGPGKPCQSQAHG